MRPLLVLALLGLSLAFVPSVSAAPCNGQLAIETECWIEYVEPRVNSVVDTAQETANDAVDDVQGILFPEDPYACWRLPPVRPYIDQCW